MNASILRYYADLTRERKTFEIGYLTHIIQPHLTDAHFYRSDGKAKHYD